MTEQFINNNVGTITGDLTGLGGLATIRDGNTIANNPNFGAYKSNSSSAYFKVEFAQPKVFSKAILYGWNDRGFIDNGNQDYTINIRGDNSAGPIIGTVSDTDSNNTSNGITINSNDLTSSWDAFYFEIIATNGGTGICLAEAKLYEISETGGGENPTPTGEPWIVLCHIGQSHEGGDADIQDQSAYSHKSKIKMLLPGTTTLVPGSDPVSIAGSTPFETRNSMGSNMECANELSILFPNYTIVIAARCKGNTALSSFLKGGALYASAIADWQYLKSIAPAGSIFVFGSWQGESDNGNPTGWDTNRLQLADDVRSDLSLPDMFDVIVCCDSRWTNILAKQRSMTINDKTSRVYIDDLPVPSAGDIKEPEVYRIIGIRRALTIAAKYYKFN